MEEAWELTALGRAMQTDWSSRHTRLRYQAVISSLLGLMGVMYGIDKVKIPGAVEFESNPEDWIVKIGLLAFALFSTVSFYIQHRIESQKFPISAGNLIEEITSFEDTYFGMNAAYGAFVQRAKGAYSNLSSSTVSSADYKFLSGDEANDLISLSELGKVVEKEINDFQNLKSDLGIYFPGRFSKLARLEKALNKFNHAFASARPVQLSNRRAPENELEIEHGMKIHHIQEALDNLCISKVLHKEAKAILDDLRRDLKFQKSYQYIHSRFLAFLLPFMMACGFIIAAFGIWIFKI